MKEKFKPFKTQSMLQRGRPAKTGDGLQPHERVFAAEFAAHGDKLRAARAAGAAEPNSYASRSLQRPRVLDLIGELYDSKLGRLVQLSLAHCEHVLESPKVAISDKTKVVKLVFDEVKRRSPPDEDSEKEIFELSPQALARRLAAAHLEVAALEYASSPVVEHEPIDDKEPDDDSVFG